MDWLLERMLIAERLNWSRLPAELDEIGTELTIGFRLLEAFRMQQAADEDLEKLSQRGLEVYGHIQELRERQDNDADKV
jgi:hypothetical protein